MQDILDRYIRYLKADRVASQYTVRNYISELVGNYSRGEEKGKFQGAEHCHGHRVGERPEGLAFYTL